MTRSRYRRGGRWPYNTSRWKAVRRQAIIDAHGRCAECHTRARRLDVHHVTRLTDDDVATQNEKAAFESPLQVLCISCHSMITMGVPRSERTRRSRWKAFIDGG